MKTTATQNQTINDSKTMESEALPTPTQSFNNAAGEQLHAEANVTREQHFQVRGSQESLYVHHSQQTEVWTSSRRPRAPHYLEQDDINLLPRYREYTPSPTPEYGGNLDERIRGVGAHTAEFEPMHARSDGTGSQMSLISISSDGSQRSGAAPHEEPPPPSLIQPAAGNDNSPTKTAPSERPTAPETPALRLPAVKRIREGCPTLLTPARTPDPFQGMISPTEKVRLATMPAFAQSHTGKLTL